MPSNASRRGGFGFVKSPLLLFALLVSLMLVQAAAASAQTGTITGTVTDQSGVPLQGASVIVLGAETGGNTNAQGTFNFPKVPVGVYTVRVKMAGKADQERQGVKVDANRTTNVGSFSLIDRVYQMQTVDVTSAGKLTIRKKDSSTKQLVTSEDLRSLPIDNYKDAISLKAGVISQGGELHFRGGRADEVLTVVNGIASRNPLEAEGRGSRASRGFVERAGDGWNGRPVRERALGSHQPDHARGRGSIRWGSALLHRSIRRARQGVQQLRAPECGVGRPLPVLQDELLHLLRRNIHRHVPPEHVRVQRASVPRLHPDGSSPGECIQPLRQIHVQGDAQREVEF